MAFMHMDITGHSGQPRMTGQFLDRLRVHAAGIQRRGAEVPQTVRGQVSLPVRQPPRHRVRQPGPQSVRARAQAASGGRAARGRTAAPGADRLGPGIGARPTGLRRQPRRAR
jgi:hypothetical protein